jgi:predicted O-methyltransferase YrrM
MTCTMTNSRNLVARDGGNTRERLDVLLKCIRNPRLAYSRLRTEFLSPDPIYREQSRWVHGTLPRIALTRILPQIRSFDLSLVRPFDRTWGTSITIEELSCIMAIAKAVEAKKILEIGTWDGNTTVNLAATTGGLVTTLDLPPETSPESSGVPNMTERGQLGRQFQDHTCRSRIRQVFGDSTRIDWKTLEPPFDLIFIDGAHHYDFVARDTENAKANLAPGGAIVWHDYGIFQDVSRVVDLTAKTAAGLKVCAIEGTRLAIALSLRN